MRRRALLAAGAATLGLLAVPLTTSTARADYVGIPYARHCFATVSIDPTVRTATQTAVVMDSLMWKAQSLAAAVEANHDPDSPTQYVRVTDVDLAAGSFVVHSLNIDERRVSNLYRYDYRVTSFEQRCSVAV
ncbi:hypothetical protein ACTQ49_02320 [Luteococcus sp. Sow4_B9]|uniref:hypothetical protein n=1 Tax=Luteococcus sp. Sow4_B9 TaxID=3438792 RepID=UPI003F9B7047